MSIDSTSVQRHVGVEPARLPELELAARRDDATLGLLQADLLALDASDSSNPERRVPVGPAFLRARAA